MKIKLQTQIPFALLLIAFFCSQTFAQEGSGSRRDRGAKDPRESMETVIKYGIQLLEDEKYGEFLTKLMSEKEMEKAIKALGSKEALIGEFKSRNANQLLNILKSIENKPIQYAMEKRLAVFKLDKKVGGLNKIVFEKVGKYWYIKNN